MSIITFLPYEDFARSAGVLDRLRLGRQRSEVLWLLNWLSDREHRNYPIVRLWKPYPNLLVAYGRAICLEWMDRGYEDNTYDQISEFQTGPPEKKPSWLGDERLHSSHRGRLLKKSPEWYTQFGWTDKPCETYFWPLTCLF